MGDSPENTVQRIVLTERQERFVEEYLVDLNARQAAIRAGYSPKTAHSAGPRLRRLPQVAARIERAMAERTERVRIEQDRVVAELARLAFSDVRQFADWDDGGVRIKESEALGPEQSACIAEIVESPGKDGRKLRVKLHGKTRALEVLCRHLGLFEKKPEVAGDTIIRVITRAPEPSGDGREDDSQRLVPGPGSPGDDA
ncbi:terminase small subunit [Desulfolutivibrio sulfoxidireducens]|uniref:terminase small subunit n=1 Tax=Desulfolutivibrio sulfoxidireducens TaxID=2773299 RepID=UPI00159DC0C1|nr:terminase small subunit [Desulfolutivibrio sulfoxidireducens]QLA17716.1 terminase small subunit [Desulfolutivibrio sulfoxidireducens]QLA21290.1 terminase small subunit [Desulfolutivibrio sulfoxidireducens]